MAASWTPFNINHMVRVRLTDRGREIHRARHDDLAARYELPYPYVPPGVDDDGWSEFQLWDLMHTFGADLVMGLPVPFETGIEFQEGGC